MAFGKQCNKGFSNIYGAFGVSSIHEYISAFLWLDTTFISLHFINLIFIGSLYYFLVYGLIITKINYFMHHHYFCCYFLSLTILVYQAEGMGL